MIILAFVLLCILPVKTYAEKAYIIDETGLLTSEETTRFQEELADLSDEINADVVVYVAYSSDGYADEQEAMVIADDFFDYTGYGRGENGDGVLFLLLMDGEGEKTGIAYLSTKGRAINAFTDKIILEVTGDLVPYLRNEDYSGAVAHFIEDAKVRFDEYDDYVAYQNDPVRQKKDAIYHGILGSLGFGLIVAIIRLVINKSALKTIREKNEADDYRDDESFNLRPFGSRDIFLRRSITKTKVRTESHSSSSSSSSSTHTSSSGSTHGGGGTRF